MWKALDLTIVLTILLLNCGKGLCQESYEITTIARWGQLFERHYRPRQRQQQSYNQYAHS